MVKEHIDQCIKDNQGINIGDIASEVSISCGKNLYENILNYNQKMLFWWKWEVYAPLDQMYWKAGQLHIKIRYRIPNHSVII